MKITFYKKTDGTKPAGKYIKSLDTKHKAKVVWEIDLLEKYGFDLKEPHVKPIKGKKYHGLYELRYMKDYIERKAKENENSKK